LLARLLIYQPLKLVSYDNVPLIRIRHDDSTLSLMLAFVKVSFSEFNSHLTITGPPTHSEGGQTSDALWHLSSSVTLHGGPVEFRPVTAHLVLFYPLFTIPTEGVECKLRS